MPLVTVKMKIILSRRFSSDTDFSSMINSSILSQKSPELNVFIFTVETLIRIQNRYKNFSVNSRVYLYKTKNT